MRAAIYARYSSDRQRAESIDDQIRVCSEFASKEGLEVSAIYADRAQSGTRDDREQFQRMIADSASSDWERVIVYKLDRFSRDRYASAIYRKQLRDNGVSVLSATEGIPDTPEGMILESVIEGFNAYYSKQLAQNVKRGMEGNARKCKANGVRLYGYAIASGEYEIEPREAAIIRRAFEMRAGGYRIGTIANELSPIMGKSYKQAYNLFRDAFRNPKYKGDYRWGNVYIPDGMPAIVSHSLWEQAQKKGVRMKSKRAEYPLAGRVFGTDGKSFHGESAKGRKHTYYYYSDCSFRISRDKLESIVSDAIRDCLEDGRLLDRLARGTAAAAQRFERSGRSRTEVEKELSNITELISKAGADEFSLRKFGALRAELEEINLSELKETLSREMTEANIREWIKHFAEAQPETALETFVHSVTIDHEGNEVREIIIDFNWDKTSEPAALDGFALDEFGTPGKKISKITLYPWGFSVLVA